MLDSFRVSKKKLISDPFYFDDLLIGKGFNTFDLNRAIYKMNTCDKLYLKKNFFLFFKKDRLKSWYKIGNNET